ncbi:MAG: phosphodiester glycosidase family protein [Treponema sp.]|nr:phosphodiester glycosidase family protein [Treponema sp.]
MFLIVHFFFISCATLSPVEEPEGQTVFAIPDEVFPRWSALSSGLDYFAGKVSRPRIGFYALRVDLASPDLRIAAAPGASDKDGKTVSTRVSSFVRDKGLLAGINALPFDPVSAVEGEPRTNVGIVIADGFLFAPPHNSFDALVFYTDGNAAIVAQSDIKNFDNIENAVGGFYRILENGELAPRVINSGDRHPRSAAGISPDGKFLYLLVIDGRQINSIGATEAETALLLRALGATEGINFDGGGSSALALRYPDGKVRAVNTPIHGLIPGRERAVAGCLGVR